jgi:hypothetical protein
MNETVKPVHVRDVIIIYSTNRERVSMSPVLDERKVSKFSRETIKIIRETVPFSD